MSTSAPIAIFIYNRSDHLQKTLTSLLECEGIDDSPIFVFADGPKHGAQCSSIEDARHVAKEILGERAEYQFSDTNKGLATSIISGVELLLEKYGRVIVLEDDFELATSFLSFMNMALDRYADDESVYQISGYSFSIPEFRDRDKALFLPLTTTWGWGTWKRAWKAFDHKATGWEQLLKNNMLRKDFNFGNVYDYTTMLQRQMQSGNNSWGVRWYWSVFKHKGVTLFPPRSLVHNLGMDDTGTHGGGLFRSFNKVEKFPDKAPKLPDHIKLIPEDVDAVRRAIWQQNGAWVGYVVDRLKKALVWLLRFIG